MAVNKVEFGGNVILDLTDATATPAAILTGFTAYGADGSKIKGTAQGLNLTVVQSFSQPASPKENTLWIKKMRADPWVIVEPSGLSMSYSSALYDGIAIVGKLKVDSLASSNVGVSLVDGDSGINLFISDVQGANDDPDTNQYGWCPLDCQLYKNGAWRNVSYGAEGFISVTYPAGSYCLIEDTEYGVKIVSHDTSGYAYFSIPYEGDWVVSCYNSSPQKASQTVNALYDDVVSVTLSYSQIPEFTYTGDYEIVNDAGETISVSQGNWNIRLLTSGNLSFQDLRNAANGIDIFLVGGGGGGSAVGANPQYRHPSYYGSPGGGSGYTATQSGVSVSTGTSYAATIGAGGEVHADGGASSITIGGSTYSANGGKCSTYNAAGGDGGSGGAGGGDYGPADGGTDGSAGGNGHDFSNNEIANGGKGQGTTTRAFSESSGVLYANGGGAGGWYNANTGGSGTQSNTGGDTPNTGNGGKGGGYKEAGGTATGGGSGIIIIRNHRA